MKIKVSLFLILSFIFLNPSPAQKQTPAAKKKSSAAYADLQSSAQSGRFTAMWRQADSLAGLGQPKSALAVVNKIYLLSKAENNHPQAIKAVIYRIRLNSDFQEDFFPATISELQEEIQSAGSPAKQVLQSILGEVYWKYYQNNQYRLRDRTQMMTNLTDSIETWDLATIYRAITRHYMSSLENAASLQQIPIAQYDDILDLKAFDPKKHASQVAEASAFTPTLYDFLADRALEFFTAGSEEHSIPAQRFEVDRAWYFAQTFNFTGNRMLIPADSAAPASFALRIFRDLATFHFPDRDPRALIDAELKRFDFVHREYTMPGKDSLYLDALRQFEKAHDASPWGTAISHALAEYLNSLGQLYQPLVSDLHKWDVRAAREVCDRAIQRFPDSEGAKNCKILVKSIDESILRITAESAVLPDQPSLALVSYRNMKQLHFRLVKADPEEYGEKTAKLDQAGYFRYLTSMPAMKTWSQNLPGDGDFQQHSAEISIPEVPAGFWLLLCASSKEFSDPKQAFAFTPFWSTQISYISKRNEDGSLGYFLLDRETGLPLKNIKVEAWEKNYNARERQYTTVKMQDFVSDGQGYLLIPPSENNRRNVNLFLKIRYKNDLLITDNFYHYPGYSGQPQTSLQTMFYTDRAIYRPGQNIYFKGIIIEKTGDKSTIKANKATRVRFTDANGQKIGELALTSNEFGSVNGTFTAPKGMLAGQMTISNESGSVYISVEEYKRPTFEVISGPLEGNYRLGESIEVTGNAVSYAGNAIDGATVKYRVVRTASFPFWDWGWRRPMPVSPQVEIISGVTNTDAEGKYVFSFPAIPDPATDKATRPVFDYTVYADVTDINGETQSLLQLVSVGYNALLIGTTVTDMVNLSKDSAMKITTTNLNGRLTPATVTITLQRLRQPVQLLKPRLWERPDLTIMTRTEFYALFPNNIFDNDNDPLSWPVEETVFEKSINTKTDSIVDPGIRLAGSYLLLIRATDPFGEIVEKKQYFTAFSPVSKVVPVNAISWFVPLKTTCEPGENARFLVGTKEDNVNLIYEIRHRDSLVSREMIRLSNRAMVIEIPVTELYRGNFAVNFMFIKHNRVFQNSQVVNVPYTNKNLDITFETFRNKLDPGAKEAWKIRISDAGGNAARAEFLAGMYDASLDIFRPNEWKFNIYQRFAGIAPWDVNNAFRTASAQWFSPHGGMDNYYFNPGFQLNWFGMNYFGGTGRHTRYAQDRSTGMIMMESAGNKGTQDAEMIPPPEVTATGGQEQDPVVAGEPVKLKEEGRNRSTSQASASTRIRRDFSETAFFYPTMLTDSTGSLVLQFTAPESLTRWKLLGLAHTKDLEYGLLEKELVTRKDLMVFPNSPRFVRQGDTVIFSAKVVNLAGRDLSGIVTLELSDAITLQPLNSWIDTSWKPSYGIPDPGSMALPEVKGTRQQPFNTKMNQSSLVSWKLYVPFSSGASVLQYRITAASGSFSDGEEKAIPVLTNRMMVTESLPLPVRGKGTSEFSFGKLLKSDAEAKDVTLKNYKLTLEFASNPAWYAIQALPVLNDKKYENADALFAAFWSNSLAAFIANSNPKIKAVFESWKELAPDALKSNLAKNQELKSALLQETPWVMDANNETERKQKLGLYFDLNNLEANLLENLMKLKKLQSSNGGWSWFAGMPENRWITQNIITGMAHLDQLGVTSIRKDPETWNMVVSGIGFLDQELIGDLETQKRYDSGYLQHDHLTATQIQYLYARSYFMDNTRFTITGPGEKFREAFEYYRQQAEKYWLKNDRHLQGMIALALNRLGNTATPGLILKSLSEKAIVSDEMGMYWAGEPGFFWYQAPIETQALMIELYDEVARDEKVVEALKIWLLKQKQTQDWRSQRATLEACYALLLRGTDLLSDDPGVKIIIGKEKISSEKLIDKEKEAGTGYFQVSWTGNQVKPEMGKISITKNSQGVAWGALYWQYFENLDKIIPAATPLKLEKKLFIERNTPAGPILEAVSNDESQRSKEMSNTGSPANHAAGSLKTGDKLKVRIILTVDRHLEFVHMKDMRASAFEPYFVTSESLTAGIPYPRQSGDGLSGYHYQDGLGYYQTTTDQATNFFFDYLPKGTYVFEYALKVNASGEYSNGITTIQCMYAPEFAAHSEGIRVKVQ